jgi:hypothetical protein
MTIMRRLLRLRPKRSKNDDYELVRIPEGAEYIIVRNKNTGLEYAVTRACLQCKSDITEVS